MLPTRFSLIRGDIPMKLEYFLMLLGILLALGLGFYAFHFSHPGGKNMVPAGDPCTFGNVRLCNVSVPSSVQVEYKATLSPELLDYYSKGELYVFHSCVEGGRVEDNYRQAQMKVAQDISDFLGQVVRSTSSLIKRGSSEFYSRAINVLSNNVVVGMIVLSKYHYVEPPLDKYCVIAFYNPEKAIEILKSYSDLLNYLRSSDVSPEDFEKLFMDNAKKLYSVYGK